jgi:hypothetical protein
VSVGTRTWDPEGRALEHVTVPQVPLQGFQIFEHTWAQFILIFAFAYAAWVSRRTSGPRRSTGPTTPVRGLLPRGGSRCAPERLESLNTNQAARRAALQAHSFGNSKAAVAFGLGKWSRIYSTITSSVHQRSGAAFRIGTCGGAATSCAGGDDVNPRLAAVGEIEMLGRYRPELPRSDPGSLSQ